MFFQSAAHSYVCPMLDTKKRYSLVVVDQLKSILTERLFLQVVAKATLVILFTVLVAQLGMQAMMNSVEESIMVQQQEYHVLVDKNISLLAEKAYLLSPQRIEKIAAEKLALFAAGEEQIRIIN